MTNDNQPKTLAELNVKPGDVVFRHTEHHSRAVGRFEIEVADHNGYKMKGVGLTFSGDYAEWTLVPRAIDLTTITAPFGLLDEATQTALKAHGGPYQLYEGTLNGWRDVSRLYDDHGVTYRVKPAPKRETIVNREMYITSRGTVACNAKLEGARPVTLTYDTIDGKINLASYRLEDR